MRKNTIHSRIWAITLLALFFTTNLVNPTANINAQAQQLPANDGDWFKTDLVHLRNYKYCLDSSRPATLLKININTTTASVVRYNWATAKTTEIKDLTYLVDCPDASGFGFGKNTLGKNVRYNFNTDKAEVIDYLPSTFPKQAAASAAPAETLFYYWLEQEEGTLFVSTDKGLTWVKRKLPTPTGKFVSLATASTDGKSIYVITIEPIPSENANTKPDRNFILYSSPDGGITWQKRFEKREGPDGYDATYWDLAEIEGNAPSNFVNVMKHALRRAHNVYISSDSGQTLSELGYRGGVCPYYIINIAWVNNGLVKYKGSANCLEDNPYTLEFSTDGKNWQELTTPEQGLVYRNAMSNKTLHVVGNNTIFISNAKNLWRSTNLGKNWQLVGSGKRYTQFLSLNPTVFLGSEWTYYDLSEIQQNMLILTEGCQVPAADSKGTNFTQTGQTLGSVFKPYWEKYGGLAQFGYPTTSVFCEKNPSDGKVYPVQYFERNRFEYHAENKGTRYEVLLGLLGTQLTESYRTAKHGAFNRFSDQKYAGGLYFPETGHNLRNSFKEYWEKNGGLVIYGYPISEEFEEVNPDDGKSYIVQYFERNRFEYHPENKGTRYEVLLGLLGNSLLRQKGWL